MTENGETEVTLAVDMADTEIQLLDNFIKRSAFVENELADLKKVQYLSQERNRSPFIFLSWGFIEWVYRITYDRPVRESMIKAEGDFIYPKVIWKLLRRVKKNSMNKDGSLRNI
jgi:hypothetical protein